MDKDRTDGMAAQAKGAIKQAAGNVQAGAGKLAGDTKMQADGNCFKGRRRGR